MLGPRASSRPPRSPSCSPTDLRELGPTFQSRALLKIGLEAKDTIVTAAQRYIEQGRQEGRQEGEAAVLLRLVRQRFGAAVDAHVERCIATASIAQLDTWATRIFSATTLSELLAD